ncbi:MAG: hypothetical protein ACOYEW_00555 [Anaerolineae bacterium]|jgi:hypothetical protein
MAPSEITDGEIQATEGALARLFAAPQPDERFVRDLRERLLACPEAGAASPRRGLSRLGAILRTSTRRRAWAAAGLALALALGLGVALVGPAQVLAELGRLRGYLFGVGFVDLEGTRALLAPVSVTREGVTLTVEQLLAQPDRTVARIRAEGLPLVTHELGFQLRLPDGRTLDPTGWSARQGEATVDFPPLPEDVYRVDLLVGLPGMAPETWEVALGLHPTTGEMMVAGYTTPYTPEDASDSHQSHTLRLLEVAQGAESTALNLEITWPDAAWRFPRLDREGRVALRDDLGHVYYEGVLPSAASLTASRRVAVAIESHFADPTAAPTPAPDVARELRTITFGPVSPSASRLTLTVDALTFSVPVDAQFTLDLGEDPQLGQEWPLDVWLEVAGLPLHITGARLQTNDSEGEDEPPFALVLNTDPLPSQDGRSLSGLSFSALVEGHRGSRGSYDPRTRALETALLLETLPRGRIAIQVGGPGYGADVSLHGPWVITWEVPGGPPVPVPPLSLRPEASQTRDGLTLRIEQMTVTDRLSAVTLGMEPGPDGETLVGVGARLPGSDQADLYHLTDERGNRYDPGLTLGWEPAESPEFNPHRLLFPPLPPLAGQVSFHAPAIVVLRPAPATLEVTVPQGVREGGTWPVDVTLSVGGHDVHFTEARLQNQLVTLSADARDQADHGGRLLAGLSLSSVIGPDGVERPLATSALLMEQFSQVVTFQGRKLLLVGFSAGTGGGLIRPGTYRVQVAGVNEAVPGPWELTWQMPQ